MRRIFKESELSLSADYNSMVGFLTTFQRQGENRSWDTFRNKLPPLLLKLWGDLLIECRRNGFVLPAIDGDKIIWRQVIGNDSQDNGDLCTMCFRECRLREMVNSGEAKQLRLLNPGWHEPKPCWIELERGGGDEVS
jgi:hypothetical protein